MAKDKTQAKDVRVVEHVYNDPFTMVKVEHDVIIGFKAGKVDFPPLQATVTGVGMSKRNEDDGDIPNRKEGYKRAYARAIKDMKKNKLRLFMEVADKAELVMS
jgi:hypothetical protein